ncbi:unnamed protein product [Amoebophrya sp. A25]|nr:unnamed protein product [Amoebophrya sp. A25]|eukprot:GSA25T00022710001.1
MFEHIHALVAPHDLVGLWNPSHDDILSQLHSVPMPSLYTPPPGFTLPAQWFHNLLHAPRGDEDAIHAALKQGLAFSKVPGGDDHFHHTTTNAPPEVGAPRQEMNITTQEQESGMSNMSTAAQLADGGHAQASLTSTPDALAHPKIATSFESPRPDPPEPGELNVEGTPLQECVRAPGQGGTGYLRNNFCNSTPQDPGHHEICATITKDFWSETGQQGEEEGNWCICVHKLAEWLSGGSGKTGVKHIVCNATAREALVDPQVKEYLEDQGCNVTKSSVGLAGSTFLMGSSLWGDRALLRTTSGGVEIQPGHGYFEGAGQKVAEQELLQEKAESCLDEKQEKDREEEEARHGNAATEVSDFF